MTKANMQRIVALSSHKTPMEIITKKSYYHSVMLAFRKKKDFQSSLSNIKLKLLKLKNCFLFRSIPDIGIEAECDIDSIELRVAQLLGLKKFEFEPTCEMYKEYFLSLKRRIDEMEDQLHDLACVAMFGLNAMPVERHEKLAKMMHDFFADKWSVPKIWFCFKQYRFDCTDRDIYEPFLKAFIKLHIERLKENDLRFLKYCYLQLLDNTDYDDVRLHYEVRLRKKLGQCVRVLPVPLSSRLIPCIEAMDGYANAYTVSFAILLVLLALLISPFNSFNIVVYWTIIFYYYFK
jgi:hypothetical protein